MRKIRPARLAMLMLMTVLAAGCGETPDERLAELAKQSLQQQSEQNRQLIEQSGRISEAAQGLVESDAEARKELLAAHAIMQQELESQQTRIDAHRVEMDRERRELAERRARDPIVAETIGVVGTTLACVLPLLLAAYILYTVNRNAGNDDRQIAEFFLAEMMSDDPLVLNAGPRPAALKQEPSDRLPGPEDPADEDEQ